MAVLLAGCASSKKLLYKGRYDASIDKAIKKLRKKDKPEEAEILDKAYNLANDRDLSRIKYLREEDNPENWDEIFSLYSRLKYRQEKVRPVLPLRFNGKVVNYKMIDYDQKMAEAKSNAAEYYYNNGKKLLEEGIQKEDFRQAFDELNRAKSYAGSRFQDVDQLIDEARYLGISRVLVQTKVLSLIRLPEEFMQHLLAFDPDFYKHSNWVEYYVDQRDKNVQFDYIIDVNIKNIIVTPDDVEESDEVIKREVEDGFEYALDKNGNVMKDTLGNDIKIPKKKILTCTLIEKVQRKSAIVEGDVDIRSTHPDRLLKKEPITAETIFEHVSARALGDVEALNDEQKALLNSKTVPFPTDLELILQAVETLRPAVENAIAKNRRIIL